MTDVLTTTEAPAPSAGPLDGTRVVEMGQLLAGPFCGQLLGDFGADVIKLEAPGVGDPMRQWGRERVNGQSLWWPIVARNKKSVTCNLRTAEGQGLARQLIDGADVLLENFRPGTLERWGLSPEKLWETNPGLVIVRVTGFGQDGPYAPQAGYGSIGEAMGGIRYLTGDPSLPPSRAGVSLGDSLAGTFAALGAVTALHARTRTGRGQVVDSAIFEAVLALMESLVPEFALADHTRERSGATLPSVAPSNVYPTADDSSILLAANMDTVFRRLAVAMGRPELGTEPPYDTHGGRGANMVALDELISAWTSSMTADELLAVLEEAGVPAGRIYRAEDMLVDRHFQARESIVKVLHPEIGEFPMQNVFPRFSDTPGRVRWTGPKLGEHNHAVYGELGLSEADVADLVARGIA